MIKDILHSVFSRYVSTILNFLLVVATTRLFGAEGKGEISLFILNITLLTMLNNFVGGPSLVYLSPRRPLEKLLIPSYLWSFLSVAFGVALIFLFDLSPVRYLPHLFFIGMLQAILGTHFFVLMGRKKITRYNWLTLLQVALNLIFLTAFFYLLQVKDITAYISALYLSSLVVLVASYLPLHGWFAGMTKGALHSEVQPAFRELFKLGFIIQVTNIIQLFNYRMVYYFLESWRPDGKKELGVYSTAIHLFDAMLIVSKSISLVQYSAVSNEGDPKESRRMTGVLLKANGALLAIMIIPILLIPANMYEWVFGYNQGFDAIRVSLLWLFPGMIGLGLHGTISSYFSGLGAYRKNFFASGFGFLVLLVFSFLWIDELGIQGAAMAQSFAFIACFLVSLFQFYFQRERP
jgi:O-antigen/teichoic acid export membrane protein